MPAFILPYHHHLTISDCERMRKNCRNYLFHDRAIAPITLRIISQSRMYANVIFVAFLFFARASLNCVHVTESMLLLYRIIRIWWLTGHHIISQITTQALHLSAESYKMQNMNNTDITLHITMQWWCLSFFAISFLSNTNSISLFAHQGRPTLVQRERRTNQRKNFLRLIPPWRALWRTLDILDGGEF